MILTGKIPVCTNLHTYESKYVNKIKYIHNDNKYTVYVGSSVEVGLNHEKNPIQSYILDEIKGYKSVINDFGKLATDEMHFMHPSYNTKKREQMESKTLETCQEKRCTWLPD